MKTLERPILLKEDLCRQWFIGYTMPKAEKKVHQRLNDLGAVSFLPLQRVVRGWSDRKKTLEVPLFSNYIFIYASNSERFDFLQLKGLTRYVSFGGRAATVSNQLISSLQRMLTGDCEVSNVDFVEGMPVRILDGPFAGVEGVLLQRRGSKRLVITIEALRTAVSIEVTSSSVMPIRTGL